MVSEDRRHDKHPRARQEELVPGLGEPTWQTPAGLLTGCVALQARVAVKDRLKVTARYKQRGVRASWGREQEPGLRVAVCQLLAVTTRDMVLPSPAVEDEETETWNIKPHLRPESRGMGAGAGAQAESQRSAERARGQSPPGLRPPTARGSLSLPLLLCAL